MSEVYGSGEVTGLVVLRDAQVRHLPALGFLTQGAHSPTQSVSPPERLLRTHLPSCCCPLLFNLLHLATCAGASRRASGHLQSHPHSHP